MKKLSVYLIIGFMPFSQLLAAETEQLTQNSRIAIQALGSELKQTLQSSIKTKGPIESIAVCQLEAPKIASRISEENQLSISRTSLKVRNPANKPDAWEKTVLKQFEQRKVKGEAVKSLDYSEVTVKDGQKVFRYMKAIPTGEVCLMCHGTNVSQPLTAKIESLYPDDKATGFKAGDIRGAFTVIQAMD